MICSMYIQYNHYNYTIFFLFHKFNNNVRTFYFDEINQIDTVFIELSSLDK
jgi:hypothetical protein